MAVSVAKEAVRERECVIYVNIPGEEGKQGTKKRTRGIAKSPNVLCPVWDQKRKRVIKH